jgi:signal peptidase II
MKKKALLFWPLAVVMLLADCTSKRYAVEHLGTPYVPHDVIGPFLRFTLAYNPGAAFSISIGEHSRWVFGGLAIIVLSVLLGMYHKAQATDRWQIAGLALVAAGASGNLLDRLRWSRGVVDFIDIGTNAWRFWTFNVADMCVTVGAVLLGLAMLREERAGIAEKGRQ